MPVQASAVTAAVRLRSLLVVPFLTAPLLAQGTDGGDVQAAFPKDLIYVEGGKIELGLSYQELLEVTKELEPRATRRRVALLHKLCSELGTETVEVEPFYLHRYQVTNEQYLKFVEKTGYRFPYHWWRDGKPDSYQEHLPKAREEFKKEKKIGLLYWERHYAELPYAIPPGEEKLPVVFVSWRDAQAFAGWAGMRLPTEAEWLLAATGGEDDKEYLFAEEWDPEWLKKLRLYRPSDKKLKEVGSLGEIARGPFGHEDMVGNVWEWVATVGYFPLVGEEEFYRELKKLRRKSIGQEFDRLPDWNGKKRILKGACYFSWAHPEEFRIGTRAYQGASQTLEAAGFRLAKSTQPARDMCVSRVQVEYDYSFFGDEREPYLEDQIGVERYHLEQNGSLIVDYDAVAVVPVNYVTVDRTNLRKLRESSRERPLVVGTLVTTQRLSEPALEPGMYTVYFRSEGHSDELRDALRKASRDLLARARAEKIARQRGKEPEVEEEVGEWAAVLRRYGITHEEATVKNAHTAVEHVRIKPGDLKVPVTSNQFIFRKNPDLRKKGDQGGFVATMATDDDLSVKSGYRQAEMELGTNRAGKQTMTFKFGSRWSKESRRVLYFEMKVALDTPPDVTKPWRLPEEVEVVGPSKSRSSSNSASGRNSKNRIRKQDRTEDGSAGRDGGR